MRFSSISDDAGGCVEGCRASERDPRPLGRGSQEIDNWPFSDRENSEAMSTTIPPKFNTPEHQRLEEARTGAIGSKAWGPYLSERQWGTVREDYSQNGDAWNYFSHGQARSRAYRWGEDGIAGVCDERQRLCLALALWNGADPILKERMFGLNNGEGNHGEDVKEYWFYVDSAPTHSYMKCQYKIAAELARHDPVYIDMAMKFISHFVWIAVAMNPPEGEALWDEQDGF
jgi:hypothetical protein